MAMAELMRKLRDDAIDKFALLDARIEHRAGVDSAGEHIAFTAKVDRQSHTAERR